MSYYVYIIKSLKSGKIYTGISKNPEKRLKEHNKGDSKFTKGLRPWVLVYKEFIGDRKQARLKEKEVKRSYSKRIKILNNIPG
jgi:putative endonuclease